MRAITLLAVVLELVSFAAMTGSPGDFNSDHMVAYAHPVVPPDPDDDENEHRVRPRRVRA